MYFHACPTAADWHRPSSADLEPHGLPVLGNPGGDLGTWVEPTLLRRCVSGGQRQRASARSGIPVGCPRAVCLGDADDCRGHQLPLSRTHPAQPRGADPVPGERVSDVSGRDRGRTHDVARGFAAGHDGCRCPKSPAQKPRSEVTGLQAGASHRVVPESPALASWARRFHELGDAELDQDRPRKLTAQVGDGLAGEFCSGTSPQELATKSGISRATVYRVAREHKVKNSSRRGFVLAGRIKSLTPGQIGTARQLPADGLSIRQVAQAVGSSRASVHHALTTDPTAELILSVAAQSQAGPLRLACPTCGDAPGKQLRGSAAARRAPDRLVVDRRPGPGPDRGDAPLRPVPAAHRLCPGLPGLRQRTAPDRPARGGGPRHRPAATAHSRDRSAHRRRVTVGHNVLRRRLGLLPRRRTVGAGPDRGFEMTAPARLIVGAAGKRLDRSTTPPGCDAASPGQRVYPARPESCRFSVSAARCWLR